MRSTSVTSTLSAALGIAALMLAAGTALAQDVTYTKDIAPILKRGCAECHGSDSPNYWEFKAAEEKFKKEKTGPRMSSYEELLAFIGWPHTGALMRRVDDGSHTADKKPGNMYRYLGETDAERAANLKLMKAWLGEGAWNLNRWNAVADTPAATKEQIDKLKLNY